MKRIGKFTGTIYDTKDFYNIQECGVCISDEQSKDKKYLDKLKEEISSDCVGCFGCPLSM